MEQYHSLMMNLILSSLIGKGAMTWFYLGSQIACQGKFMLLCCMFTLPRRFGMIYSKDTVKAMGARVHHLKQAIASLKQDNMPVSDYFSQLKGLWDEFLNYRPIPGCTCAAKCICGLSRTLME
jgi:hypothetical protein